jgi:deazaflavin-dependent oxidoreductase (nitroreductase family)
MDTTRLSTKAGSGRPVGVMTDHRSTPNDRTPRQRSELPRWNRVAGRMLRLFNPLARWMISTGIPTGAPNVLLTVRGRQSGKLRTVPVAMLELDGAWFVHACYGEAGWVANLRASGEATVTRPGGRRVFVRAIELSAEEAGQVLLQALAPFRRSRLFRALLGPRARGPVGVMRAFRVRIDDSLEENIVAARRFPLFELRPDSPA